MRAACELIVTLTERESTNALYERAHASQRGTNFRQNAERPGSAPNNRYFPRRVVPSNGRSFAVLCSELLLAVPSDIPRMTRIACSLIFVRVFSCRQVAYKWTSYFAAFESIITDSGILELSYFSYVLCAYSILHFKICYECTSIYLSI